MNKEKKGLSMEAVGKKRSLIAIFFGRIGE